MARPISASAAPETCTPGIRASPRPLRRGRRGPGLCIGRDIAVTGLDGTVGAGLLHPPLTSVVIPVEDIARRVVGRVLRQIEDGQDTDPGEIVATWLREGESTPVHW